MIHNIFETVKSNGYFLFSPYTQEYVCKHIYIFPSCTGMGMCVCDLDLSEKIFACETLNGFHSAFLFLKKLFIHS